MRALITWCLRYRVIVIALTVVLVIFGYRRVRDTPVDVFPEFAPPLVEIQTEVPGLSSLEVEQLVTTPIELAVQGTPFVQTLRSKSVLGLSSVVMLFSAGTDLLAARQLVQERLARVAPQLPSVAHAPVMLSPTSSTSRILKIGLTSTKLDPIALTDIARWKLRPRLLGVPGVANVSIWSERDRQIQVLVDPARLQSVGLRVDDVVRATRAGVTSASGGFFDTPAQRVAVSLLPLTEHAADVAKIGVGSKGALVLSDVAEIKDGHPPPIGDAVVNDVPGLLLVVEKQPWSNTLEVTRGVDATLQALAPLLGDVTVDAKIFRPATFIERALANLRETLFTGAVLLIVILGAFLYDVRTALISMVAIPVSLLGAAWVLHLRGGTIDTMMIAGMAIALGEVVDDAIVDVENVLRRLRAEREKPSPRSAFTVVLEASLEVRSAVVFGSFIVVLVFVPVFFLEGLPGAFFRPLALAYVFAMLTSLLVALTVTPALCLLLLPGAPAKRAEAPLYGAMKRRFAPLLGAMLDHPKRTLGVVLAIFVASVLAIPTLGEAFLPAFRESDFLMHWVGKPGTSLEEMQRTAVRASTELRSLPSVKHFGAHIGRAEASDEVVGANFAELWIGTDPAADHDRTVAAVQHVVEGYPGIRRDVQTYLQERIKEVLSGGTGAIVVRIFGTDLDALRADAQSIHDALEQVQGIANLQVEPQVVVPQLEIRFHPDALAQSGLSPTDVQQSLVTMLQGSRVGEIVREGRVIEVVVVGTPQHRTDPTALAKLELVSSAGRVTRLGDIAQLAMVPAPNIVSHEAGSRKIDVSCDARGRDLGSVARDVVTALSSVKLSPGNHVEITGEHATRTRAQRSMLGLALLSLFGIGLVVYADFKSLRVALLIMATLPLALTGCVAAVFVTGRVISLGSLVGAVSVLGVAVRNTLLLVSHFRHLEDEEGVPFGRELVTRGTQERLVPIVMTSLSTVLALAPLIVGGNRPGQEIEYPMAIVILGGLTTSVLLTVFAVPAAYLLVRTRTVT